MVRAALRLATADFSVGAALAISVGSPAAIRDCWFGEDYIRHLAFSGSAKVPRAGDRRRDESGAPSSLRGLAHTATFFEHAGIVEWVGRCCRISFRNHASAEISWADLIRVAAKVPEET